MRQDQRSGGHDARNTPAPPLVGGRPTRDAAPSGKASPLPPFVSGRGPSDVPFDEADGEGGAFPLDAFFVPEDSERLPMGMGPGRGGGQGPGRARRHEPSAPGHRPEAVANRLEELATGLRTGGVSAAQLWAADPDPLRRALGEALTRFFTPADR